MRGARTGREVKLARCARMRRHRTRGWAGSGTARAPKGSTEGEPRAAPRNARDEKEEQQQKHDVEPAAGAGAAREASGGRAGHGESRSGRRGRPEWDRRAGGAAMGETAWRGGPGRRRDRGGTVHRAQGCRSEPTTQTGVNGSEPKGRGHRGEGNKGAIRGGEERAKARRSATTSPASGVNVICRGKGPRTRARLRRRRPATREERGRPPTSSPHGEQTQQGGRAAASGASERAAGASGGAGCYSSTPGGRVAPERWTGRSNRADTTRGKPGGAAWAVTNLPTPAGRKRGGGMRKSGGPATARQQRGRRRGGGAAKLKGACTGPAHDKKQGAANQRSQETDAAPSND